MSIQLQEIQSIFISQNRLVEGKDYVRAEWLKKNGLARIDIPTNYNMVDSVTTYFKHYGGTMGQMPVFGGNKTNALLWKLWENSSTDKSNRLDTYFNSQYFFDISAKEGKFKVKFNWQDKKRLITWNDVSEGGWLSCALDKTNTKISVFDSTRFNQPWHIHTGALAMKYFFLAPNIYLCPCQLLRDIPATLDANGIARTAGECGMIDSISGKFYGNVASSGAFSVENVDESGTVEDTRLHQIYRNKLIEGKDYMIGEWLKGDGSAHILHPNTDEFEIKINPTDSCAYEKGDWKNHNTAYALMGFRYHNNIGWFSDLLVVKAGAARADYRTNGIALGEHIITKTAISNAIGVFTDGVRHFKNVPTDTDYVGSDLIFYQLKPNSVCGVAYLTCSQFSFVPCRLLRPIPRNLDAQCKSRQTGECGMIDLVSGRFYGNVAESGTFSLAWDEWLKDCSIKFNPETTLGYNTSIPNDYVIYGRIEVAKLTAQYTDFGFMQASNNYIILGESTVYAINDWGTNKWATFVVSYSGGYECSLQLNGVTLTTVTSSTPYDEAPHIQLHGIMQINKIEHTFYPDESDPTQSQSEVWKRFVEEDGRQGLGISDLTYKIYAD